MSFPKAKIHRYYDEVSCAPPPGKYHPKSENKVKGAIMDKSKRFGTPVLEHAHSVESLDSCCSSTKTPLFRTPSKAIPKKTAMSSPRLKLKTKIPLPDKFLPHQISDNDQKLIDQINELTSVHQNQLIEKNQEIACLMEQVNGLNEKVSNLLVCQGDTQNKSEHKMEINKLRRELIELQMTLSMCNQDYKSQVDGLKSQISALEDNISNQVSINNELEESIKECNVTFEDLNNKVSQMAQDYDLQLNTFFETISKIEDINKCLMEDYRKTVELLEKESGDNLENKRILLEMQESIDNCREDLSRSMKRCKMYEVVQTETSKTINVLSKRLMESEVEVDHLNDIQQELLLKKNILEGQVKTLSEENQTIRESLDCLQNSLRLEMETMENQLLEKVEAYKLLAIDTAEKQKVCITEKQNTIDILLAEIDYYKNKKSEVESQLTLCEDKVSDYQNEIFILKSTVSELENNFEEKIGAQRALFSQLTEDYEALKSNVSKDNHKFEKAVKLLNQDKSSLERVCADKDQQIESLLSDIDKLNHQVCQNQNRIKHLETLTMEYDEQIYKMTIKSDQYINTIDEKNKLINNIQKLNVEIKAEKEIIFSTLAEMEEKYNTLEDKYKNETHLVLDLKRDMKDMQNTNHKYMDEVISELVLEKERVTELTNTIDNLKTQNNGLKEENNYLKSIVDECGTVSVDGIVEKQAGKNQAELNTLKKTIQEQSEMIQLFEYERISQFYCHDEFLDQKDELLKTIERQNREIEVLSETTDRQFAAQRELEQEVKRLNEEKEQLKDAGTEDSMKVTSLEARIADLECRNQELSDIIGPFRSQLIQFEQERSFLLSKTENTEKELKDLALIHAESLGHQNHKQKIKYMVNMHAAMANMKKDIERYRIENIRLRQENRSKKLGSVSTNQKKNKENKTKSESKGRTTSPTNALKDRNG